MARASPTWELCSHTTTLARRSWWSRWVDERVERGGHVAVAEVPRRHLGAVHLLVVLLGVADEARVLLGEEELVLGDPAVAAQVCVRPAAQLDELGDDLVLARDRARVRERVAVRLPSRTDVVEAAVSLAGPACLFGVDAIEVRDDRLHRGAQAVEVEAVEARLGRRVRVRVVAGPQPLDELQDVTIAPHPRREAAEVRQGGVGVGVVREPHDVAVDAVRVGPVRLDRDGGEAASRRSAGG